MAYHNSVYYIFRRKGDNFSEEQKKWSEETLEAVEKLCLFDDDFVSLVFERNKDATGKEYDIEVQRSDAGAIPRRARFHNAMVDVRMLNENQKFKEIEDSYVIFITQNDVMKKGLPLYHVERVVKETGEDFEDGSHIIYVNGAYKNDENPIGRLVHDFGCVRSADMYNDLLKKQVHYFKESEGGRTEMCEIIENLTEKKAKETHIEDMVNSVKLLMKNAKMSIDMAFDTLEIPTNERDIILKKI